MKYSRAFDMAEIALREAMRRGSMYRDGVVRAAAMAACNQAMMGCGREAIIRAMVDTFDAYKVSINPKWDGSIA